MTKIFISFWKSKKGYLPVNNIQKQFLMIKNKKCINVNTANTQCKINK